MPCPQHYYNTTVCLLSCADYFFIKINHQRTQQHTSPKAPFRVPPNETRVCAVTLDRKAPRRSWLCSLRKTTETVVAKLKIVQLYTQAAATGSRTAVKTKGKTSAGHQLGTLLRTTGCLLLFHGISTLLLYYIGSRGSLRTDKMIFPVSPFLQTA